MLAKFKSRWGDVSLVCADVSQLPLARSQYDFIFSNAVCQYMDQSMLASNLDQVYGLLDSAGVYLIGNIPDAQLRLFYYAGALRADTNISWRGLVKNLVTVIQGKSDSVGKWYSRRAISELAAAHGFTCDTFSSSSYEYRFHAVLKKTRSAR